MWTPVTLSVVAVLATAQPLSVERAVSCLVGCEDMTSARCLEAVAYLANQGRPALQSTAAAVPSMKRAGQVLAVSLFGNDESHHATVALSKVALDPHLSASLRAMALGELTDRFNGASTNALVTRTLLKAVRDAEAPVRAAAARALGNRPSRGDQRVIPALVRAAGDTEESVRLEAVLGLGMSGSPRAGPALIVALGDPSARVRIAAADGLTFVKHAPAVRPLIDALRSKDAVLRRVVGEALAHQTGERFGEDYPLWKEWYAHR